ncbi:MAG: phage holin family protein [Deltaproteobacteria bacterium]|nr:phage holin family protein [Deltaproteobacteria bacterium]MBW2307850.1 phage holin family protein [Deltaproteobacteria bacterium]
MLVSHVLSGIEVRDAWSAIAAAFFLGLFNAFLRPVFIILTLPATLMTFGFFILVINGLILLMVSGLVEGFRVTGFWFALLGSILISLISFILNILIGNQGRIEYIALRKNRRGTWSWR